MRLAKAAAAGVWLAAMAAFSPAGATPYLVIDQDSGAVLEAQDATEPWYPASLTKMMTAYVVLDEIRAGRVSPDSLIVVSANAASQAPSKMGFRPGTQLTVDNALKMMLVKSANDIAVTLAEGIGGSVPGFADMMNRDAQRLGMRDSHFENPNGLPNMAHHSSAQDLAILARALLTEFPQYRDYFGIGAIALGDHIYHTYNNLLGRYPGVDGMKTGFICAGGFNTVVSAVRGDHHLIAVVLGQPSASERAVVTAALLDKAFAHTSGWGSLQTLTSLTRVGGEPPDMHSEICGRHRGRRAVTWEQEVDASTPCAAPKAQTSDNPVRETAPQSGSCGDATDGKTATPNTPVAYDPVPVFVGPSSGTAAAIQLPATTAALAALEATAAKSPHKTDTSAATAYGPAPGTQTDTLPGGIKVSGAPVHLHGAVDQKPGSRHRLAKKGRAGAGKLARKTPAATSKAAAAKTATDKKAAGAKQAVKTKAKPAKSAND